MHPNPVFHTADQAQNIAYARERGFGLLAVSGADTPLISHIPFVLNDEGTSADLHLLRSNPITRALKDGPLPACLAVSGPDGYVSPDWYGVEDQVPTWNYVAVHLTGQIALCPDTELSDLLARQSAFFESRLAPKPPWTLDKMNDDTLSKMLRMIVPARLMISDVDGTWKLNQNKPDAVRLQAADCMEAFGFGSDPAILSGLMRGA